MTSVKQLGHSSQELASGDSSHTAGTGQRRAPVDSGFRPPLLNDTHTFYSQFCISLEVHHFFLTVLLLIAISCNFMTKTLRIEVLWGWGCLLFIRKVVCV